MLITSIIIIIALTWIKYLSCPQSHLYYRIEGNFHYQALKAYFRGLIFVVCPPWACHHSSLLARFLVGSFSVLGLSVMKITPMKISRYTVYKVKPGSQYDTCNTTLVLCSICYFHCMPGQVIIVAVHGYYLNVHILVDFPLWGSP